MGKIYAIFFSELWKENFSFACRRKLGLYEDLVAVETLSSRLQRKFCRYITYDSSRRAVLEYHKNSMILSYMARIFACKRFNNRHMCIVIVLVLISYTLMTE